MSKVEEPVEGEARQAGMVTFHRLGETRTEAMFQMDFAPGEVTEQADDKLGFVERKAAGDLKRFESFVEGRGGLRTGGRGGSV
ncbi:hypothetical protein O1L60_33920 [Streptomyces diastatochromogenes]|nr:hypothetical protein [Streptomyces diastatochromogenes]